MKNKKRVFLILAVSIFIIALASVGVIATLRQLTPLKIAQPIKVESSSPASADILKSQAYAALKKSQFEQAKKLFEQAKVEYEKNNDVNAIAEIDGQLFLINHTQQPIPTPTPTVIKM